ncbi:palmitoyltransferase ZDHHC18-B-like [Boleophthalmus pectinirostris]|uniref:palmitoyltransferase ZDHHC18-B-like n=1 Tax=Boleophthalmus pectinirostris TaxID=150288 RepID=UPI00242B4438|nr:palmitoyltransferase ZDHHC18-B-like [Boleophthalmus pectinirostris]
MKNDYQQIDPKTLPMPAPSHPPSEREAREEDERQPEKQRRKPRRKWQVFPGRNRFFCDGRIVMARKSGVLPLTLGLILVTSGLFFVFDCPFLVQHLTMCVPVIGGLLFVFVLITLLQTTLSDPGILPRATPDEAADIEKQIDESRNSSYQSPPRTREVEINGQVVKLKYCPTCKMFRPPRTSHCRVCDNCVERFDHHCPWVGNCVGKRNYRFFYSFIVSLSFHTAFIFGCVTTHLALRAQGGKGLVFALQESPGSAVELVVCFFSVWSIVGLSGFHTYLVASNRTTNEDIKGSWSGKSGGEPVTNPYSHRNICTNCCSILCGPMPPSLIDRRGFLPEDKYVQTGAGGDMELPALTTKNEINVCTQGTKVLLESAARSPLLSSSCPQGKSQSVHTCSDNHLTVHADPAPELSNISPVPAQASPPRQIKTHTSPPQRTKTHSSKRKKHTALHMPNSSLEDPAPPTSVEVDHHHHHHRHHHRSKRGPRH